MSTLDKTIAERICANGRVAGRERVAVLDVLVGGNDPLAWVLSDSARATIFRSGDAAEGCNAFLERRSPMWSGR